MATYSESVVSCLIGGVEHLRLTALEIDSCARAKQDMNAAVREDTADVHVPKFSRALRPLDLEVVTCCDLQDL